MPETNSSSPPKTGDLEEKITYCSICEQVCGLKVTTKGDQIVRIEPDKENPYSWEDFCIKAATSDELRTHPARLLSPMKRVGDRYVAVSYEDAIGEIADAFRRIMDEDGPDAIGSYTGNPNGFCFTNSVFHNAFMDALGSHNRFWVGSVDQNAVHYVGEEMYGSAWTALIPDVDDCKCFLLIGSNPAISAMNWVGAVPRGWKRMLEAMSNGAELIVIDPRKTETAQKADLHLSPLPEMDWAFLLGVLRVIFDRGWVNEKDCAEAVGVDEIKRIAQAVNLEDLSARCDIPVRDMEVVAEKFARAETATCLARTGSAMGRNGVLTEWLTHVLNLVTGRTDRPGGRILSQGVANVMDLGANVFVQSRTPSRVRGYAPVAGAHAVAEIPDEIETPGKGRLRGFIINGGNPVVGGPDGDRLDAALSKLECLVAVDLMQRESHRHAHWLIPGVHFLEREEIHVLIGCMHDVPFVQGASAVVSKPSGVRHEWEFYKRLAEALGVTLFSGVFAPDPTAVEEALLGMGGRMTREKIKAHPHGVIFGERQIGNLRKSLYTPDKKIHACPPDLAALLKSRLAEPASRSDIAQFPYQLITRRRLQMMNSWLTESSGTRIRKDVGSAIEINTGDATRENLQNGDLVSVQSSIRAIEAVVHVSSDVRPGVAVMEHGWGSRTFDPVTGAVLSERGKNRNRLVSGEDLDPLTRVPRFNGVPVRIERRP
ncbi:molybdopterin-dependent oxidoreductase [Marinicaulis aureus]|uniref:Molybdopterin-dependent oxidoreductase n=1 Tax=Hyphococcus aureus TaxID=2666033 RepID=A0ABW1KU25_9PROT